MIVQKAWYTSWTIWVQVITVILAILASIQTSYPDIAWVGILIAALNAVLRFRTDTPIGTTTISLPENK